MGFTQSVFSFFKEIYLSHFKKFIPNLSKFIGRRYLHSIPSGSNDATVTPNNTTARHI